MDLAVLIGSERFDPQPAIPHLVQHNEHIPFLKAQLVCLWHFGEGKHSHHFSPIINRLKNAHRINFRKYYCKHTLTYSCELCNYILNQLFHRGNFFFVKTTALTSGGETGNLSCSPLRRYEQEV